ncbi:MAG: hypothetical protein ACI3W5_15820 [Faecousia sp.]
MDKQKRFKKQKLNSDNDRAMEQGAKALKGSVGALLSLALVVANKDNLKALGKGAVNIAKKVVLKK